MSIARRIITSIFLCAFVELPLWSVTGAGGKDLSDTQTSLYRLDPTYGRALLPLNAVTLKDAQFSSGFTVGPVSGTTVPQTEPEMHFSPHGTTVVTLTNTCAGCQLWHAKYVTVRVIDTSTGMVRAHFHPRNGPYSIQTVSDDGSTIGAMKTVNSHPVWLTLDGHTGKAIHSITLPDYCCAGPLLDPSGNRLYLAETNSAHQLAVAAFDLTTGTQLTSLALPSIPAGSWGTESSIIQYWTPGIALSPGGKQLAVFDGRADAVSVIDALSMKVVSTRSVAPPSSVLDHLGALLGLAPITADAKGLGEGGTYTLRYSRDGSSLFLTGTRASVDGGHEMQTDLGIERISANTGELQGSSLSGVPVWWMDEAADGSALYTVTPSTAGQEGCPCTLQRLDPATLDVTATRTFTDVMLRLYILTGA